MAFWGIINRCHWIYVIFRVVNSIFITQVYKSSIDKGFFLGVFKMVYLPLEWWLILLWKWLDSKEIFFTCLSKWVVLDFSFSSSLARLELVLNNMRLKMSTPMIILKLKVVMRTLILHDDCLEIEHKCCTFTYFVILKIKIGVCWNSPCHNMIIAASFLNVFFICYVNHFHIWSILTCYQNKTKYFFACCK